MRPGKHCTLTFLPTFLCLVTILLAGCGGSTPQTGPPVKASADKQVLLYPLWGISDIPTFDPALAGDIVSATAIFNVFTGLVALDDHLKVQPQLAASYQQMPDGLTWKFTLRPDLKFSDGTPLTSQDVVYSLDHALQPAEKSSIAPFYLALIKDSDKLAAGQIKTIIGDSLLAPDPNTVIIVTNKKVSYFLDTLTYPSAYVVERKLIDKYGEKFTDRLTEGGGDGPFKVAEYIHGQRIVFVPNPNYYGPIPQLRKLVMPLYQNPHTVYEVYQAGQVSMAMIPPDQLTEATKLTREFHITPLLAIDYYGMNYLAKPFDNIKNRQAFALAINKDAIVHAVWRDSAIATNHIVPQGMPGYNPDLTGPDGVKGTAGDPAKARALFQQGLQEEGMTRATLPPIRLTYIGGLGALDNEVVALQQVWQTVLGVGVILDAMGFNRFISELDATTNNPKGLQLWSAGWLADYPDPQDWTTLQFDKGSSNNSFNYGQNNSSDAAQQQQVQQLLEQADVTQDQATRLQMYNQAEQQLVNDVAWLPMKQETEVLLRKPCVVGMVDNPGILIPPNDWGSIYISTATPCANTSSF